MLDADALIRLSIHCQDQKGEKNTERLFWTTIAICRSMGDPIQDCSITDSTRSGSIKTK